jgi:putative DNA modification/repair radical SAM protein
MLEQKANNSAKRPMDEKLSRKLRILADAAKYDASCSSSGAPKRKADVGGLGSTVGSGICHAYTPDGRCVSLLKILLTNYCLFDCAYCVNRRSSNVKRAKFSVDEVVTLTVEFYKRNYIEGLFLSSGIIRSPDYTMEQMLLVAKKLRRDHGFRGYIHLKTIPEASPWLIEEAGLWADRLSINLELPTETSLERLAPEKDGASIESAMAQMFERIEEAREERRHFSPAGQTTQMIVGADETTDQDVLRTSAKLYGHYAMKRVYYSAFSPIPDSSAILPLKSPPLMRESRLYQADWLLRYYGFNVDEIASGGEPQARLGAQEPTPVPGGRESGRARDAAARAGPRRAGRRQDRGGAKAHHPAAGGRGPAHLGAETCQTLSDHGGSSPESQARQARLARAADREARAVELVRMIQPVNGHSRAAQRWALVSLAPE